MTDERTNKDFNKRALILFTALFGVSALVVGLFIWAPWDSTDETPDTIEKYSLTSDATSELEELSENIVQDTGDFGLDPEYMTNNNIQNVSYTVSRQDESWDRYADTRGQTYEANRSYLAGGAPIDYDSRGVSDWDLGEELNTLMSFELQNVEATASTEGTIDRTTNNESRYATVTVEFESKVTRRLVTAEDTSWDGSYRVLEKPIEGSATFTFKDVSGDWKLYNVEDSTNEFLLALWLPNFGTEYSESMFGFREVEILTPDEPYTPENEGSNE